MSNKWKVALSLALKAVKSVNNVTPDANGNVNVAPPDWNSVTSKPNFSAVATSGSYNDLSNKPAIPAAYTLPAASASTLGGVKQGSGVTIDSNGVISANGIVYNVKAPPYNAKGNGSTDDTAAFQNCLNACASAGDGCVYIPKGTYMINALVSLNIPSNIRIVFSPQAVLKVIPNNASTYYVFNINNVSNVFIEANGATIQGDRDTHTTAPAWQASKAYAVNDQVNANGYILKCTTAGTSGTSSPALLYPAGQTTINDGTVVWTSVYAGEYGMGVNIVAGSNNIFISNLNVNNVWGDGFYLGGGTPVDNIFLTNCSTDSVRRNGISITNAKNVTILGGKLINTNGTDPQYGIDVEPNANCIIQNVNLIGMYTKNNWNGGYQLCPMFAGGQIFNVNVEGCTSENDLGGGFEMIGGSPPSATEVFGKVNIRDCLVINPWSNGVYFTCWRNMPKADVDNVTVINPNTGNRPANQSQSAFVIYASPNDTAGTYGGINFRNCGVKDNRGTPQTYAAYFMACDSTHTIQNVNIIDPFWEGLKNTLKGYIYLGGNFFGNVKFTTPSVANVGTSQATDGYLGQEINATAAITMTLSSSNSSVGNEFTVRNGAASGTVNLAASAGDTIIHKGTAVTSIALTVAGTFVKVRSIGSNKWVVVEHNIS